MSSTSKMQQEATKPLNKSQTSGPVSMAGLTENQWNVPVIPYGMNKQLAQLANIAREITASLEESCSSIDENAQAAIEAYEEIQNSNRITKAHVKRAAKEARHTERIARKLLKQAFDKQQQSNKTLEKEDSCVDIGHTNDDTLDHHQTLKNDDTLYNNTPDEHTKMDDALNEEKQEDQVGFDNMSTSK
eukprot:gene15647-17226_t